MAPLDLHDVDLLLHQGFARELIFDLVIEKATITPRGGDPIVAYNDPSDPRRFAIFQSYIRQAMLHGLTTQSYLAPDEDGGDAGAGKPARPKMSSRAVLCYDRALASPEARKDFPPNANLCGAPRPPTSAAPAPDGSSLSVVLDHQELRIDVTTRSVFGMFSYLGGLIARGDADQARLHAYPELTGETTAEAPLLMVVKGGGVGDGGCFIGLSYEGERYCVPQNGADNTKRIFNILNALLALKTAPGDLPVTQTVRIAP